MNYNQHLVSEFRKLGNISRKDAAVGLQVYLELCEVRKYWNVEAKYSDDLQLLFFTAKKSKSEDILIFIPRASTDGVSFNQMQNYFKLCNNGSVKTVFLALVSGDSTCVFYQLSDGLKQPTDVTAKHLKVNKEEQLEAEVRKNRNLIKEAALCGIPITIRPNKNPK